MHFNPGTINNTGHAGGSRDQPSSYTRRHLAWSLLSVGPLGVVTCPARPGRLNRRRNKISGWSAANFVHCEYWPPPVEPVPGFHSLGSWTDNKRPPSQFAAISQLALSFCCSRQMACLPASIASLFITGANPSSSMPLVASQSRYFPRANSVPGDVAVPQLLQLHDGDLVCVVDEQFMGQRSHGRDSRLERVATHEKCSRSPVSNCPTWTFDTSGFGRSPVILDQSFVFDPQLTTAPVLEGQQPAESATAQDQIQGSVHRSPR